MQLSSDYTPVWESGGTATSPDFEASNSVLTDEQADEAAQGSNTETNGPLTPTTVVEGSGWTQDDVMLAAQFINIILFLLLVYETFSGGA